MALTSFQNREDKHFIIKSVGDSKKIFIFERSSIFLGRIREFLWKFVIAALTKELQKKLL